LGGDLMVWALTQAEMHYGGSRDRGSLASGSHTLTVHPLSARLECVTTQAAAVVTFTLPDAQTLPLGGPLLVILNDSSSVESVDVLDAAGGTIETVAPGETCKLFLAARASAAGTWKAR